MCTCADKLQGRLFRLRIVCVSAAMPPAACSALPLSLSPIERIHKSSSLLPALLLPTSHFGTCSPCRGDGCRAHRPTLRSPCRRGDCALPLFPKSLPPFCCFHYCVLCALAGILPFPSAVFRHFSADVVTDLLLIAPARPIFFAPRT